MRSHVNAILYYMSLFMICCPAVSRLPSSFCLRTWHNDDGSPNCSHTAVRRRRTPPSFSGCQMPTQLSPPPPSNRPLRRHALPKYRHAFCLIREAYQGKTMHLRPSIRVPRIRVHRRGSCVNFLTAPCERRSERSPPVQPVTPLSYAGSFGGGREGGNEGLMMPHKWRVQ